MGDPNIHRLLEAGLSGAVLEAEIEKIYHDRLDRLQPLFEAIQFEMLFQKTPHLRWLDLGSNDGSILAALKQRFPTIEACGLEHRAEEYQKTYAFLQASTPFTMKSGSWHDDTYPLNSFDIVASIHAWPLPPDYLARMPEIRAIEASGRMFQQVLFDKAFALQELQRFMDFAKPGGYVLIKTWSLPLHQTPGRMRLTKKFPFFSRYRQGESFDFRRHEFENIGRVIYLNGMYLALQKP